MAQAEREFLAAIKSGMLVALDRRTKKPLAPYLLRTMKDVARLQPVFRADNVVALNPTDEPAIIDRLGIVGAGTA